MTAYQKEQIPILREKGASYAAVAETLGLSVNAIKSFCRRNVPGSTEPEYSKCEQCKTPLKKSSHPGHRFCSNKCRMDWWHKHPKKLNQKAVYHFTCPVCNKAFTAYGNAKRKYCSCKCYGKAKKAVRHD